MDFLVLILIYILPIFIIFFLYDYDELKAEIYRDPSIIFCIFLPVFNFIILFYFLLGKPVSFKKMWKEANTYIILALLLSLGSVFFI